MIKRSFEVVSPRTATKRERLAVSLLYCSPDPRLNRGKENVDSFI